jgi:hypothetical protein
VKKEADTLRVVIDTGLNGNPSNWAGRVFAKRRARYTAKSWSALASHPTCRAACPRFPSFAHGTSFPYDRTESDRHPAKVVLHWFQMTKGMKSEHETNRS